MARLSGCLSSALGCIFERLNRCSTATLARLGRRSGFSSGGRTPHLLASARSLERPREAGSRFPSSSFKACSSSVFCAQTLPSPSLSRVPRRESARSASRVAVRGRLAMSSPSRRLFLVQIVEIRRQLTHARRVLQRERRRCTGRHLLPPLGPRSTSARSSPAGSSGSAPPRPSSRRDEALGGSRCRVRESGGRRAGLQPASEEGRQGQLWTSESGSARGGDVHRARASSSPGSASSLGRCWRAGRPAGEMDQRVSRRSCSIDLGKPGGKGRGRTTC